MFAPICPPVQCPVPSLNRHYLYAKFKPHPCAPYPTHLILHCCTYFQGCQCQRILDDCAWPAGAVRYKKCQFSSTLPKMPTPTFFHLKPPPWCTGATLKIWRQSPYPFPSYKQTDKISTAMKGQSVFLNSTTKFSTARKNTGWLATTVNCP